MTTLSIPQQTTSATQAPEVPAHDRQRMFAAVLVTAGAVQLASLLVNPGPDVADVRQPGWVPGHLMGAAAYILFAAGLPALFTRAGKPYGLAGAVGYLALAARFAVSTGSQLYYAAIVPQLADVPGLHQRVAGNGRLAEIYTTPNTSQVLSIVLAALTLPLVLAMWRSAPSLRRPAVLFGAAQLSAMVLAPAALLLMSVLACWLGVRALRTGDVAT